MDNYDCSNEERIKIAQYFESKEKWGPAAKQYEKAGLIENALQLYMKGGQEFIEPAIAMVAKSKDKIIQETLMNYLNGANGGTP